MTIFSACYARFAAVLLRTGCVTALAFVILALTPATSPAAIRLCGPIVSSEVATAPAERDAKKKALDQWRAAALKRGPGYDSWRLAASKTLKCFPKDVAKGGGFECVAFGAPCIINQTPASPVAPPGVKRQGI